ncbi:MAG: site-specific integrase [Proteobacteria bacterium]|nr:site-specific integrase [Pseudomonadota bacterium]
MPKLTKSVIDCSVPKEKNYIVWDTEIKGFGCQISKGGRSKTYVFYYYSPIKRKKGYIKIGCHGNITVDLARNAAKKFSADIALGIDPKVAKKEKIIEEKQSMLFCEFFEVFKTKYVIVEYKDKGRDNMSLAKLHILPYFAQKKLEEISAKDIRQFLESLSHITTTANRCFALLSMAFRKAEDWEYLPPKSNPCTGVRKYKENKKQRFLSHVELKKLEESLLQQKNQQKASYCTVNAILLILYTGCRKREILDLKWDNVHLKDGYIHLPDTKVGETARPLNQKALDLLSSMTPKEDNPYVFYGKLPGKPLAEIKTAWGKVLKRAEIKDFRIHDLRHSFASLYLSQGVDLYTVSKLLGHKNIATTTRYAHLELEQLKKATNKGAAVFG